MNRDRRKDEIERAYQVQVAAGLRGAAQFGAGGLGVAAVAHRFWPAFRCVYVLHVASLLMSGLALPVRNFPCTGGKPYPSKPGSSQYVEPPRLPLPSLCSNIHRRRAALKCEHNPYLSGHIRPCHLRRARTPSARARGAAEGEQHSTRSATRPRAPRARCDRDGDCEVEGGACACGGGCRGGGGTGGHQGAGSRVPTVVCIYISQLSIRWCCTPTPTPYISSLFWLFGKYIHKAH